ncbi:MAG: RdgB/HAM1 family non-canonical purine NTP pyrophosphatase [Candidatus Methanomethylophilaceae archaeon]|nr:RdgB/HAM1 family non-canonical purine NTP pyrophosphatase [Candidatus Methanomethylophilaceae archaeon]
MRLAVITSNPGKVEEYRAALSVLGIEMEHRRFPYMEPQVDDLNEVVRHGLEELRSQGLQDFIIDDSGLFVESLKGFPGVYSAYALKTLGNNGLLRLLDGQEQRRAEFQCCIGCSRDGMPDIVVRGSCQGVILTKEQGEGGFGFDPIFSPDGERSFAQMGTEEKNAMSHRGRAVQALAEALRESMEG